MKLEGRHIIKSRQKLPAVWRGTVVIIDARSRMRKAAHGAGKQRNCKDKSKFQLRERTKFTEMGTKYGQTIDK